MRVDRGRADPYQTDQAALDEPGPALLVDVQRGRPVGREHALVQPVAQPRGRDLPGRPRVELKRRQGQSDDVVRRGRSQLL
jgi:hypothetical protein